MQVAPEQFQPAPDIETSVTPTGGISVMVTIPLVSPAPAVLLTTIEYVAPICPLWKKLADGVVVRVSRAGCGDSIQITLLPLSAT